MTKLLHLVFLSLILLKDKNVNSFSLRTLSSKSRQNLAWNVPKTISISRLHMSDDKFKAESQIAKLKAMAAQLRAEAAELEAERRESMATAIAEAFDSFDTNRDGSISIEELRAGLQRELQATVSEEQAKQLMSSFDSSGDGALQLDEFKTVKEFQDKLEYVIREERNQADKAAIEAREAKIAAESAQKLSSELAEYLNERPPTVPDRLYSVLPYLLPFLDTLPYGTPLLHQIGEDNPIVNLLANLFNTYNQIPFSGLVAFFALNIISNNLQLNRLIRFNLQQAILLDIALIIPGLIGGTFSAVLPGLANSPEIYYNTSTLTFALILMILGYCTASSLAGVTPNKLPIVSSQVEARMPSISNFLDNMAKMKEMEKEAKENKIKNKKDNEKK